jgi:hypothetical protein
MVAVMSLGLVGCDYAAMESEEEDYSNVPSMFFEVEDGDVYRVVYHKDTKVMYVVYTGYQEGGGMTPLYNPDGTLKLYEESENK